MIQIACTHDQTKPHGKDRKGHPRVKCVLCQKSWTVKPAITPHQSAASAAEGPADFCRCRRLTTIAIVLIMFQPVERLSIGSIFDIVDQTKLNAI